LYRNESPKGLSVETSDKGGIYQFVSAFSTGLPLATTPYKSSIKNI
jgi:hypothetical protein